MSKKGFDFQESYFSGHKELKGDSGINQKNSSGPYFTFSDSSLHKEFFFKLPIDVQIHLAKDATKIIACADFLNQETISITLRYSKYQKKYLFINYIYWVPHPY